MINPLVQSCKYLCFIDKATKAVRGRVNYSKSHIKLVMEPVFEPKQSHAISHYTALLPIVGAQ